MLIMTNLSIMVIRSAKSLLRVFLAWAVMGLFSPSYAAPDDQAFSTANDKARFLRDDSPTSEYIESKINHSVAENGGQSGDYSDYSNKLAHTFSLISDADQSWIFGD